jgi:hypothetical protein
MSKRFFELYDDASVPGRWHLTNPTDSQGREVDDPWRFTDGQPVRVEGRLKVPIEHEGRPLGFTLAGLSIPVVHVKAASLLAELAPGDVQLLPVDIEGQPDPYLILVATRLIRCIDEQASRIQFWTEADGLPEKVGQYASVRDLRIDPSKVGDAKVFRTEGWDIALVVSEDIKAAMESAGVTGARFEEVTGPSAINPEEDERWRTFRELWQQADTAREAAWRTLGRLEEDSIISVAVGGSWPSRRQAWRVIHRSGGHLLLVTAGLSDPFYGQTKPSTGFGLELALETSEPLANIEGSWPLLLLGRVADEVAEHEQVRESVKAGLFSMEVSGKGLPRSLVTEEGRVAVLLGVESHTLPSHFSTPYGEVKLVTVKALLPSELAYLLEHGAEGQAKLARRFVESGEEHLSHLRRKPVA